MVPPLPMKKVDFFFWGGGTIYIYIVFVIILHHLGSRVHPSKIGPFAELSFGDFRYQAVICWATHLKAFSDWQLGGWVHDVMEGIFSVDVAFPLSRAFENQSDFVTLMRVLNSRMILNF